MPLTEWATASNALSNTGCVRRLRWLNSPSVTRSFDPALEVEHSDATGPEGAEGIGMKSAVRTLLVVPVVGPAPGSACAER